jgi:hypothetical protein
MVYKSTDIAWATPHCSLILAVAGHWSYSNVKLIFWLMFPCLLHVQTVISLVKSPIWLYKSIQIMKHGDFLSSAGDIPMSTDVFFRMCVG